MPRFHSSKKLLVSLLGSVFALGLAATPSLADTKKKAPAPAKKAPAKKAPTKAPPPKKAPPVTEANKKKLQEYLGGFKFGMSKDEVVAMMSKKLSEDYDERLKKTTDVAAQDRIRKDKKSDLARMTQTFVAFDAKPSPWDVSIVEGEFAHNTDEAMMERWENQGGKNQRRFFFFYQGKLWKMFVSLDVSILPEDKKNFETFQAVMNAQFGAGLVEPGLITWSMPDLKVRALDKLKTYDAIGLVLEDPITERDVLALRVAKAPAKKETSSIIKAVIDTDHKDKPDVKANNNAVDEVIKAQKK